MLVASRLSTSLGWHGRILSVCLSRPRALYLSILCVRFSFLNGMCRRWRVSYFTKHTLQLAWVYRNPTRVRKTVQCYSHQRTRQIFFFLQRVCVAVREINKNNKKKAHRRRKIYEPCDFRFSECKRDRKGPSANKQTNKTVNDFPFFSFFILFIFPRFLFVVNVWHIYWCFLFKVQISLRWMCVEFKHTRRGEREEESEKNVLSEIAWEEVKKSFYLYILLTYDQKIYERVWKVAKKAHEVMKFAVCAQCVYAMIHCERIYTSWWSGTIDKN